MCIEEQKKHIYQRYEEVVQHKASFEEAQQLMPPNSNKGHTFVHPNTQFQEWVQNTYHTTIPKTALEVVTPYEMGDDLSSDPFLYWFINANDE